MTKFIKLTECKGNTIVLNVNRIEHITLGARGTDTYIKILADNSNRDNYFFVKESIDEVWNMIIFDNTKAPVIMTAVEALDIIN